jgi:hypothetical protein
MNLERGILDFVGMSWGWLRQQQIFSLRPLW